MFKDDRYNCVMPQYAYDEFIKKAEFKEKFPWRSEYKQFLRSEITIASALKHPQFKSTLNFVSHIAEVKKKWHQQKRSRNCFSCNCVQFSLLFCR